MGAANRIFCFDMSFLNYEIRVATLWMKHLVSSVAEIHLAWLSELRLLIRHPTSLPPMDDNSVLSSTNINIFRTMPLCTNWVSSYNSSHMSSQGMLYVKHF
jgi:hypothetical protein